MSTILDIIFVEDNEADARLVLKEIQKAGFKPLLRVVDKKQAYLRALDEKMPDVILADYRLPHFSGMAALEIAREQCPQIPFIIVTGSLNEETAVDCIKAGAWDYVIKDHLVRLGAALKNALSLAGAQSQKESAQKAFLESEEIYRTIFQNTGAATMIVEDDMTVSLVNAEFERLTDYTREEIEGKHKWTEFVHPDDLQMMLDYHNLRRNEPESAPRSYEARCIHKTGQLRYVLISAAIIPGSDQSVVSMIDITAIRDSAAALHKSEDRYRILASNIPNGIVLMYDENLKCTLAEGSGITEGGLLHENIEGKRISDIFDPAAAEFFISHFRETLSGNLRIFEIPYQNRLFEVRTMPLKNEQGQVYAGLALLQDITERKSIEESLRQSQETYQKLMESSKDAIFLEMLEGVILQCNDAALQMFGYTRDEMLQLNVSDLIAPQARADIPVIIQDQVEKGGVSVESFNIRKNGQVFPVEVRTGLISSGGQQLVTAFVRDLTEARRNQKIQQIPNIIAGTVHQSASLNELFVRIQHIIGEIMDTKNFFLALYDSLTDTISLPYFVDEKDTFDSFPAGKTLTGYVIRNDRALLVRQAEIEEMGRKGLIEFHGTVSKVWLGVPLKDKDKIGGALVVQSYTDEFAYTEEDLEFLELISNHVTLAIDRKRAEEELRLSEERFSSIFMQSPLAIIITRVSDGIIVDLNQTASKALGQRRQEILGRTYAQLIGLRENSFEDIQKSLHKNQFYGDIALKFYPHSKEERVGLFYGVKIDLGGEECFVHMVHDITEQRKAEDELKRIHAIYRESIEMANGLPYRFNFKRGNYEFVGDNAINLLGIPGEELTPQKMGEITKEMIVTNPEAPRDPFACGKAFREGKIKKYWMDLRVVLDSGQEKWLTDSAIPIVDPANHEIIGCQGILQDITERKRIEDQLLQREMEFRALVENTPDVIARLDADGRLLYVNPVVQVEFGLKAEEIQGKTLRELALIKEIVDDIYACLHRVHETQSDQMFEMMLEINSRSKYFYTRMVPEFSIDKKIESVLTITRDITEIKKAEFALKESEERYRTLFNSGTDSVYVFGINTDGTPANFTEANEIACKKSGYTRKQFQKMNLLEMIVSDQKEFALNVMARLQTEKYALYETEQITRSGSKIPIEMSMHLIEMHGENVVLAIIRDITERKQMEREIQRSEKLESVGILAGGIAHDFNNILTVILGNITLAKMLADPQSKLYTKLNEAEKGSMRARDLTQQLLTFSKGGSPIKKATSVAELLKESAGFALTGSNVKPEFTISSNLWTVEVDEGQINQVFNNLVINADQAMPEGGRLFIIAENAIIKADEKLPLQPGRYIRITLKDEGIGIPKMHLSKIFDPYFTTKAKGSGIGLTTVYSIIKNHGGLVTVDSELGVGTSFYIYLPASTKKIEYEDNFKIKDLTGKGRILIMDDEETVREVAGQMLIMLGYEVDYAVDGREAIEKYRQAMGGSGRFDAVIMDLTVPGGMGGKETIKELLKIDPEVTAVVSSGYSNDPVMASFKDYGFKAVVAKPYKVKHLGSTLHEIL